MDLYKSIIGFLKTHQRRKELRGEVYCDGCNEEVKGDIYHNPVLRKISCSNVVCRDDIGSGSHTNGSERVSIGDFIERRLDNERDWHYEQDKLEIISRSRALKLQRKR